MSVQYSLVVTSCGRMDLLRRTIKSFKTFADVQPSQIIVSENSCNKALLPEITNMFEGYKVKPQITIHEENRGQIWAIDHAYSRVDEDLIFHLEDDWAFFNTGFITPAATLLAEKPQIFQVSFRRRNDGSKGAQHPVSTGVMTSESGIEYLLYQPNYLGVYHGFSFNPNLRRLIDYQAFAPYKQYGGGEEVLNAVYNKADFKFVCLNSRGYCWHTGEGTTLSGANS